MGKLWNTGNNGEYKVTQCNSKQHYRQTNNCNNTPQKSAYWSKLPKFSKLPKLAKFTKLLILKKNKPCPSSAAPLITPIKQSDTHHSHQAKRPHHSHQAKHYPSLPSSEALPITPIKRSDPIFHIKQSAPHHSHQAKRPHRPHQAKRPHLPHQAKRYPSLPSSKATPITPIKRSNPHLPHQAKRYPSSPPPANGRTDHNPAAQQAQKKSQVIKTWLEEAATYSPT